MQRILSVQASRSLYNSQNENSEYVTKRLCCSFILTVAFFSILGGFLLGKFVTEHSLAHVKLALIDLSKKVGELNEHLKKSFHNGTAYNYSDPFLSCNFQSKGNMANSTGYFDSGLYLYEINRCFNTSKNG